MLRSLVIISCLVVKYFCVFFFFFQAEDGIRDGTVTGVQTCALPIYHFSSDADHIAAIDNVTRKMMHAGKRPVGVGFLFSLGHSTIVLAGAAAIAGMALTLQERIGAIKTVGGIVGTLVSTVFLFAIAL